MRTDFETYWGNPSPIKRALSNLTATGDIIAAVTGKRLVIVSGIIQLNDATTTGSFKLNSGTTDISGTYISVTGSRPQLFVFPFNPAGWWVTAAGEKFAVTISAIDNFTADFQYVEVN